MRERVVRIGNADLVVGAVARLARELERHDARDVALHRQHLQVEHQPRVIGVRGRHARGPIEVRHRRVRRLLLGLLNASLDLAHRVEILTHPRAILRPERPLQPRDVVRHRVEQAGSAAQARAADRRRCRLRRTAARTRGVDALPTAAGSSATTTTGCSDRRTRSRCRTAPSSGACPSTARATAEASGCRFAAPPPGPRTCRGNSRCSPSTSLSRRSGTTRSTSRASRVHVLSSRSVRS